MELRESEGDKKTSAIWENSCSYWEEVKGHRPGVSVDGQREIKVHPWLETALHSWLLVIHRSWLTSIFIIDSSIWSSKDEKINCPSQYPRVQVASFRLYFCPRNKYLKIFFLCHEEWYKETTNIWFNFLNKSKLSCNVLSITHCILCLFKNSHNCLSKNVLWRKIAIQQIQENKKNTQWYSSY